MLNQDTVIKLSAQQREPSWMLQRRLAAFAEFERSPMPSLRYGIAIQMDISALDITKINPLQINSSQNLGGRLLPTAAGVCVQSFTDALTDPMTENIIKQHLWTAASPTEDKFSALHAAFFNQGVLIHVKQGTRVDTPIILRCDQPAQNKLIHILVVAETGSRVTIIDQSSDEGSNPHDLYTRHDALDEHTQFCSTNTEIIAHEGAQVNYISVQELSEKMYQFSTKKALVGKDAAVFWIDCCLGSKFTRSTIASTLTAPGASSKNWGFFFGKEQQNFDLNSVMIHASPYTSSQMLTKGVLTDSAKTIYRGLIRIEEGAHHSDGHQKEETVLIGSDAEVDAVPNLEIKNDNVKCSHGAAIGQIDAEKLFYLMARGLDEATAKVKIIEGFFEPMINEIGNDAICTHIRERIAVRLSSFLTYNLHSQSQRESALRNPYLIHTTQ